MAGHLTTGKSRGACISYTTDNTDYEFLPPAPIKNGTAIDDLWSAHEDEDELVFRAFVNYKKKQKRILTFAPRIKPPTREADPVTLYICSKTTYSKPYFLSHLHHFLFRLTPF